MPRCCFAFTLTRREQFDAWAQNQQQPGQSRIPQSLPDGKVFETQACINCHTISGTAATGSFGPDLTHLMSRSTIASGTLRPIRRDNLPTGFKDPDHFKQGALMPAMQLSDDQIDAVVAYLSTLQ